MTQRIIQSDLQIRAYPPAIALPTVVSTQIAEKIMGGAMSGTGAVSRVAGLAWKRRNMCLVGAAVAVAAIAASVAVANPFSVLFAVFFEREGLVQTASASEQADLVNLLNAL